jgi:hypothetical protein
MTRKRFVVLLDENDGAGHESFLNWIKTSTRLVHWHWLGDSWLLVDPAGEWTASELRTKAREFYPSVYLLVLELKGTEDTWSGFGPNTEGRSMFKWLRNSWHGRSN